MAKQLRSVNVQWLARFMLADSSGRDALIRRKYKGSGRNYHGRLLRILCNALRTGAPRDEVLSVAQGLSSLQRDISRNRLLTNAFFDFVDSINVVWAEPERVNDRMYDLIVTFSPDLGLNSGHSGYQSRFHLAEAAPDGGELLIALAIAEQLGNRTWSGGVKPAVVDVRNAEIFTPLPPPKGLQRDVESAIEDLRSRWAVVGDAIEEEHAVESAQSIIRSSAHRSPSRMSAEDG